VLREEGFDLAAHGVARAVGPEVVPRHLIELGQLLVAELEEAVLLETALRDLRVAPELLAVREILGGDVQKGCQWRLWRKWRFVAAQKRPQRIFAFTSQGKCRCSEVTWESGHGLAKSIGYQMPSRVRISAELKSQPKNALIVSVMSRTSDSSAAGRKSTAVV
jgi:hypothetical protein